MDFGVVVDRLEGGMAVLLPVESATSRPEGTVVALRWPKEFLPPDAVEGVVLKVSVAIDDDATAAARARIANLLNGLRSPSDRGVRGPRGGGRP